MRVGLFLRNLDEEFQVTTYRGVRAQARRRGVDLVCVQGETVGSQPNPGRPFSLAETVPFDGLLILTPVIVDHAGGPARGPELQSVLPPIPCVSVGMRVAGLISLAVKNRRSLTQLITHLVLDHGYRRLLFLGGPPAHRDSRHRERVFRQVVRHLQPSCPGLTAEVDHAGFLEAAAMEVISRRLAGPPFDAVVAANDNMASGVLKVLKLQAAPEWRHCAVTGFDDVPQAALEVPPLTTIHQPLEELGRRSLDTLVDHLTGHRVPEFQWIDSRPVLRESCGCRPIGQPAWGTTVAVLEDRLDSVRRQALTTERRLRQSNNLGRDLSAVESLPQLLDHLDSYLSYLNVWEFSLVLTPDADEARGRGRLMFDRREGQRHPLPTDGVAVDGAQFFAGRSGGRRPRWDLCLGHLRSRDEHLGWAVYAVDDGTHSHLASALPHLANALKRLKAQTEREDRNRELERMVEARTRDLVSANHRLRSEADLRKTILETLPIPVAVFSSGPGIILYANQALENRVGRPVKNCPIRDFLEVPSGCDGVELWLRTDQGSGAAIPVLVHSVHLEFDGKAAVLAGMVDLSRQRALEAEVLQISEFERRRFGLDLHDDICQRLAGITMYVKGLQKRPPADPSATLGEIGDLVDETLQLTRRYAHASFPIDLSSRGLDAVLSSLCESVSRQNRCQCRYRGSISNLDIPMEDHQALNIYRIVQEALANAVKHSQAAVMEVTVESGIKNWVLRVSDNGRGMAEPGLGRDGLGLRSMAYRAAQLGARFEVESNPTGGTAIVLTLPR